MTIKQKIETWRRWYHQTPGTQKHLKSGCDSSAILLEHGPEIVEAVAVYDALKRRASESEST